MTAVPVMPSMRPAGRRARSWRLAPRPSTLMGARPRAPPYTAKDLRTGYAVVARRLPQHGDERAVRARNRVLKTAIAEAAAELGNTGTICRKCYVHSMLIEAYSTGSLDALVPKPLPRPTRWLSADERLLLAMLEKARAADDISDTVMKSTPRGPRANARA